MSAQGEPSTGSEKARVLDLDAARVRHESTAARRQTARTCMLQVVNVNPVDEVLRYIGMSDELTVAQLGTVLKVCFELPNVETPARFYRGDVALPPDDELGLYLGHAGGALVFMWGLWKFDITTVATWPRDETTPAALCVGGVGDFGDEPFRISEINSQLTGEKTAREVLENVNPQVADVIRRSKLFDFVPLLQAYDLPRSGEARAPKSEEFSRLPLERQAKARDAFWSLVLAMACLSSDDEITEGAAITTMAALGWDDGCGQLGIEQIRGLCGASVGILENAGVCGSCAKPLEGRLELFRELLRR